MESDIPESNLSPVPRLFEVLDGQESEAGQFSFRYVFQTSHNPLAAAAKDESQASVQRRNPN